MLAFSTHPNYVSKITVAKKDKNKQSNKHTFEINPVKKLLTKT